MRRTGRVILVGIAVMVMAVDPAAACRFRLFRRACCNPCPVVCCEPCPPIDCGGADGAPGSTVRIESHDLHGETRTTKPSQPIGPKKTTKPDAPTAPLPPPERTPATKPKTKPADELPDFDLPDETPKSTAPKSTKPADDLPDFDLPDEKPATKPADSLPAPSSKPATKPANDLPDFDLPSETSKSTKPATDLPDFDLPDDAPKTKPAAKPAEEAPLDLLGDDAPADDMPADDATAKPADADDELQLDLDSAPSKKSSDDVDELFEDPTTDTEDGSSTDELATDGAMPADAPAGDTVDDLFGEPNDAADEPTTTAADGEIDFDLSAGDAAPAIPDADDAEPMAAESEEFDPLTVNDHLSNQTDDTLALAEPLPLEQAVEREWIDNTGEHRVQARLIEVLDGQVRLLKDSGRFTTVPLDRLSEADRGYVEQFARPTTIRTAAAF